MLSAATTSILMKRVARRCNLHQTTVVSHHHHHQQRLASSQSPFLQPESNFHQQSQQQQLTCCFSGCSHLPLGQQQQENPRLTAMKLAGKQHQQQPFTLYGLQVPPVHHHHHDDDAGKPAEQFAQLDWIVTSSSITATNHNEHKQQQYNENHQLHYAWNSYPAMNTTSHHTHLTFSRRYMSTTTTTKSTHHAASEHEKHYAQDNNVTNNNDKKDEKEEGHTTKMTFREQYQQEGWSETLRHKAQEIQTSARERATHIKTSARERATNIKTSARERAAHIQESAREQYQDFKEHPRESIESGAKTMSSMLKHYGPVFLGTHLSLYLATLMSLFAGIQSGILDPSYLFSFISSSPTPSPDAAADAASTATTTIPTTVQLVADWMRSHAFTTYADWVEQNPGMANLAMAWILVKFTEPIRLPISISITPRIARYFGFVKIVKDNNDISDDDNNENKDDVMHKNNDDAIQKKNDDDPTPSNSRSSASSSTAAKDKPL